MTIQYSSELSRSWLLAAILFWLANALLHQEISNWIVASYATPWGEIVPRDHSLVIAILATVGLSGSLLWRLRLLGNWRIGAASWIIWFLVAVLVWQLLTTVDVELIHYPQYALVAWLLARALDPKRQSWPVISLALLTLYLGILDELYQYFYLTPANNSYVDFNDFILNLIGACAGIIAYYSLQLLPARRAPVQNTALARFTACVWGISALAVLLLLVLGRLVYAPAEPVNPGGITISDGRWVIVLQHEAGLLSSWLNGFSRQRYYVTGVLEWLLISVAVLIALALFRKFSLDNDSDPRSASG